MVVGLGASAGGLDALAGFFSHLPPDSGMTFIVVQHLERHHPSMLPELLGRHTRMPVEQAQNGASVEPDHVYVIPPNAQLTLERGCLRVTTLNEPGPQMPADALFRSLAEDRGERAVGIVLSGTGTDGTSGLRAIKEHGGLTLAQSPGTAKHDAMPRSAIGAGLVDYVLPVEQMAARLLAHLGQIVSTPQTPGFDAQVTLDLPAICSILHRVTGHDFSGYKAGTLVRRIRRRMHLQHAPSSADYRRLLEQDSEEPQLLLKDLLIGVTQFFRDPEAFEALGHLILPRLLEGKAADAPLRIWVPGCASGEEAYSIAILVREHLARLGSPRVVQLFATDIDLELLAVARAGRYGADIAEHVTRERLERFFIHEDVGYQVNKELREMCIISAHNLTRDPPFSSLDLISCRNVLIYFDAELQKKLVPLFHYALRPGGFLFLGPSEGLAGFPELFETLDKRYRIFQRRETLTRPAVDFPVGARRALPSAPQAPTPPASETRQTIARSFERLLIDEYAPCSAVISERGEIVLVGGKTAPYLQLPPGALSSNILDHVQGNLRLELRAALSLAAQAHRKVTRAGLLVDVDGSRHRVRLTVRPLTGQGGLFALVVQQMGAVEPVEEGEETAAAPSDGPALEQLESELKTTRADLKQAVEELESSNEELKSSNEELISTNEELQSANEELQTSKEEQQSVNEELETVNTELQHKVQELGAANSDLANLFTSTEVATIFLDRELRIGRFTPAATKLFSLIDSDVGRPLGDLTPRFVGQDLVADAREVLRTLRPLERQVRSPDGKSWFILRALPYRTMENVIAGVVVTFVDISELKRAEEALRESEERFRLLVKDVKEYAIFMLAPDGTVASWNVGAERLKGYRAEEILGQSFSRFYPEEDVRAGKPKRELEAAAAEGRYEDEGWRVRKDGSRFWANVVITALRDDAGRLRGFGKVTRDFTERKRAEEALQESERLQRLLAQAGELAMHSPSVAGLLAAISERVAKGFGVSRCGFSSVDLEAGLVTVMEDYHSDLPSIAGVFPIAEFMEHWLEDGLAGRTAAIEDVATHPRTAALFGTSFAPIQVRAHLTVPLQREGKWVANFWASHHEPRRWKAEEIESIKLIAERVWAIVERKRAEEDLKHSRRGLSQLAEASLRVMRETDLEAMFQAISAAALELTGARIAVSGHGYVSGQFVIGGAARTPGMPDCPPGKEFLIERGGVYMDLIEGAADTIRLTDEQMLAHPRWWGLPEGHVPMRGLLGVRLVDRQGRTNGMILVTNKEQGDFTAENESLLRQLGTLASLASQHVEARVSLEEADRSKNQFLAMLSHELRNPLAPIRNSLYILDRAAPGGEQARRAQTVIDRQVVHLTRLVDDLLDVTRISRGKIQLRRERLDLCDVVHRAIEDNRWSFEQNGVELQVTVSEVPLWIDGDQTRIAQAIGNLLHNAAKFTEPEGKVTISVEGNVSLRQAIVRIRDTGVGIAPEMLPRVFEPFAQADTTLDRSKGGLGLGLALVKGLVEMHDGTVSVESDGLGKGAEFTVRLPLEGVELPAAAPVRSAVAGGPRRVLVIEDNVDAAESLREVLEIEDHTVELAFSGAEGIEKARVFQPEVVLCDIGLPGMDGYEVARAMRSEPALRSVALVALTGYAGPDDVVRSVEAGFDHHLAKPPSMEKLEQILASLLP